MNETQKKLYNYAVFLLSRRSYHSVNLRKKLKQKKIGTSTEIEDIIKKLEGYKFIDDDKYVNSYVSDQLERKPQSTRLVRQRLMRNGIRGEQVESVLKNYESSESERAKKALIAKEKILKYSDQKQKREKLFRFLSSRGFNGKAIMEALNELKEQ